MQGTLLAQAQMQGADLRGAELVGAFLPGVQMQGASIARAHLQGAQLLGAQLQGADLADAKLQPDLRLTPLLGANLHGTQLQGADLRRACLWRTVITDQTNFGLAELRGVSWRSMDKNQKWWLEKIVDSFPGGEPLGEAGRARLMKLLTPAALSEDPPPEFALDGPLLVDDVDDPRWQRLDRARLTADERAYDEALVLFLADLARSDPHVARGLASRMEGEEPSRAARLARGLLDRAGPALPEDVRQRLSKIASQPTPKD